MTGRRLLALNVGSTTLKGAVYALESATAGTPPQLVECNRAEIHTGPEPEESLAALLKALAEPVQRPDVVVHRIVHGGDLRGAHELDEQLIAKLDALAPFAPLHQPIALAFVRAARVRWPQARQGVAFDTDFHASLAPWSRRLPVPAEWDAMGVRRYGFHGLAFASALREVTAHDSSILKGRVVLAHLGGGCSICAVKDGRSHDTTMALTPLGGIPGPTRSGDLDPGALLYLLRKDGLGADAVEDRLYHAAGVAGIAGHGDMRVLLTEPGPRAQLALELFTVRIAQSIAAMATGIGASIIWCSPVASAIARLCCGQESSRAWNGSALGWILAKMTPVPPVSTEAWGPPYGTSLSMRSASWPNRRRPGSRTCSTQHANNQQEGSEAMSVVVSTARESPLGNARFSLASFIAGIVRRWHLRRLRFATGVHPSAIEVDKPWRKIMSMQMLATNVRTRDTRKRFALGIAMVLVLSLATAANAANFTHKYVMRGQVLDVQENTLVVCIGKEDGAQVGQVLNVVRHTRGPHRHKSTSPTFVRTDIGKVRITSIIDDHYANAVVVDGNVEINDSVELLRD